ncbi:MAG: tetratricopeptide repeat protein [Betaproteobacteria bacterium]
METKFKKSFDWRAARAVALAAVLPPLQRRLHAVVFVLLTLIVANTLFLLAHRGLQTIEAWLTLTRAASQLYQAAVLLHSALGILLMLALGLFVAVHAPEVLRRLRGRWWLPVTGATLVALYAFLLYSGVYFLFNAKTADKQWLYWSHMGASGVFLLLYAGHRLIATQRFPRRQTTGLLAPALALAVVMLAIDVAGAFVNAAAPKDRVVREALPRTKDPTKFSPVTGLHPAAPFFPSPVTIASGAAEVNADSIIGPSQPNLAAEVRAEVEKHGFARQRLIGAEGCARCHADTVAQWETSAHRFSSFNNPFYAASLDLLRARDGAPNEFIKAHLENYGWKDVRTGQIKSQWCGGCHDPALQFEGTMRREIDRGAVKAQAGLTCLACHLIKDIPGHTGSGNYVWDDEFKNPYLFSDASGSLATEIHDMYLKANPEQHKRDMLKPLFREGQYCATCHKVSLEPPLNEYRYVRGQNEYDNWHDSGLQWNAARTFYQPQKKSSCQDCHMPLEPAPLGDLAAKNGKIRSHRFLAVNTALPFSRGDQETIKRIEDNLRGAVRITFAGLRDGDRTATVTEAPQATLTLKAGETPELNLVVRNVRVGHTFPGGTNDSNEGWVEIVVSDAGGRPLLRAGQIDPAGHVVENTRIYNVVLVDKNGERIAKRNAQDIAALVYAAVIPPSASDVVRFKIPAGAIPPDVRELNVSARLLWRKFNRPFSEFVRAAEPKVFARSGPDLPVTEISAAQAGLLIDRRGDEIAYTLKAEPKVPVKEQYFLTHDYGIGLLLQGDTVLARKVLEDLVARKPDCDNCTRTLARLYIANRDYASARRALEEHERRWPHHPQGAWLWAGVLRWEGAEDAALAALNRVLETYPRDREAWRLVMEINYRAGRFQPTVEAAARILDIDPEDATAYYYTALARRALGDTAGAELAQTAYRYYQRDESAQQMTNEFRRRNPDVNFAAQPIRVYALRSAQQE